MFIRYTKTNLHGLSSHDGKVYQALKPGWNEFPDELWEANKNHPEIKRMLSDGTIELMMEKAKQGKKTVEQPMGKGNAEVSLKDFDEAKAVKVVQATYDRNLLTRWNDEESRHKVKRALDKQLEPFKDKPKSA